MEENDFTRQYMGRPVLPGRPYSPAYSDRHAPLSPRSSTASPRSRMSMSTISSSNSNDACWFIGIDFGTTYSGVAWAWSGDPDNIRLVQNWPTNVPRARDNAKAPTKIVYFGNEPGAWGYEVTDGDSADSVEWFKLLLLKDEDIPSDYKASPYLARARRKLDRLRKTPEQVIADYLKKLWGHTISTLKRERGSAAVDGLPFRVVITVPAIWQPYANEKMKKAAKDAGILDRRACGPTTLELVPEPEAAALSTLSEYRQIFALNDVFIVCDCGGGTVDIITYKITSLNPLKFEECVKGKGKLCGAIFVDEAFERLIRTRLGTKWDKISASGKQRMMEQDWENGIKRLFSSLPSSKTTYTVELPPEALSGGLFGKNLNNKKVKNQPISNGRLQLDRGFIKNLFLQSSINHISSLVAEQIRMVQEKLGTKPKGLILVGGYGACNYVYEILKAENEHKGIQVLQPSNQGPWAAICRGAAIRARENGIGIGTPQSMITSRIARYHYGTAANHIFDERKHNIRDRYHCEVENKWKARDQMHWYLKMNSNIQTQQPVKVQYYRHMLHPEPTIAMDIYQCELEPAPSSKVDSVRKLCSITCNLSIDFNSLQKYQSPDGHMYYVLQFEVEMICRGGNSVEFSILVNNVRQGRQNVQVDFM
ncbi:hypothetical protein BT63DRAFT_423384 [Microthyrium microscopicum]|uniref:Actin-like ATPase domain-containing protein n=1 Tax=Microthyrium microscopicum TaxID=703497 RepID=A0A6A6UJT4_9PEZI|nr:hypothetical protein BT63DRAFT_423384 [Microthyrium microscopicum]